MDNDGNKRSFDRLPDFVLSTNYHNATPTEKVKRGLTSKKKITKDDGDKKEVFNGSKCPFAEVRDNYVNVLSIEELDDWISFSNAAGSKSLMSILKREDKKEKVDSVLNGKAIGNKHKQQELKCFEGIRFLTQKGEIIQADRLKKIKNAIETSQKVVSEHESLLHALVHKLTNAVSNKTGTKNTLEQLRDFLLERLVTTSKPLVKLKEMTYEMHSSVSYWSNFKTNDDLSSLSAITKEVITLNRKMELQCERYKFTLYKTLQPLLCHTESEILKYKELVPDKVYQYLLSEIGKVSKDLKNAMFSLDSSEGDATDFLTEMTRDSNDTEFYEIMGVELGKGSLEESRRDQTCILLEETMDSNAPELFKRSQNFTSSLDPVSLIKTEDRLMKFIKDKEDATEANAKPDETHTRQPQSPNTKSDLNKKLIKLAILLPNTESEINDNRAKELVEPDNSGLLAFVQEQFEKLDENDIDGVLQMISCSDTNIQIPDSNILNATVDNEVKLEFVKTNYTVVVVTAEMFEEALEETRYFCLELTHSNIFPDNIRMFLRLPVMKGSHINQTDLVRNNPKMSDDKEKKNNIN